MPVIPALARLREEITSSRPIWATQKDPASDTREIEGYKEKCYHSSQQWKGNNKIAFCSFSLPLLTVILWDKCKEEERGRKAATPELFLAGLLGSLNRL